MSGPSLVLTIALARDTVSQLESPKLTVTLRNHGELALVPSAYDLSGALSFTLRTDAGIVRRASGLSQQEMMVRGRIDPTPSTEELEPGAHWSATLDLGQSMYAPPPGRYLLAAELVLPEGDRLGSNEVTLTVVADAVESAVALRDNPVLDGLALLLERPRADEPWFLRQYNTAKPLGPWYGTSLPLPARPILAQKAFFAPDSFDPFFERWLLWPEGDRIVARAFAHGQPLDRAVQATLPPGTRLLGSAVDFGSGELEVFLLSSAASLISASLSPGILQERWRLQLPEGAEGDPCVAADATGYWVAVVLAGLRTIRIDRTGRAEPWHQRFDTDLHRATLWMDPVAHRVLASFWDAAKGRHLQMLEASTDSPRVSLLYRERIGALASLREFSFDASDRGEFHALLHTDDGFFYARHDQEPMLLGPRAPRRAPLVRARPAVYLGFYDAERGYNFYELKKNRLLYRDPENGVGAPA